MGIRDIRGVTKLNEALHKIKLLNSSNPNKATAIVGGKSSGIVNWNDIRYPQFYDMYKNLLLNYWISDSISMTNDSKQWNTLTKREQEAFLTIISLLSSLDSIQTRFILEASLVTSDSSVFPIMAVIAQQEAVHNESYSYVLSSIEKLSVQNDTFNNAKDDPRIIKRNQFILDMYEDFRENPTPLTMARALVGSMILEGLDFYSGFAFFYSLAKRKLMVGTSTMISYIQRDEMQHGFFVAMLIRAILAENPEIDADGSFTEFVIESFKTAVDHEIEWSNSVLEGIDGIDIGEMSQYVKYLANKRVGTLGLPEIYEGCDENVMPWIRAFSDESQNDTKTDFFEQKARSYAKVSEDNGFDDL